MTNEEKRKETEKSDENFEVLLKELKEMRTCQERLEKEKNELLNKIDKLGKHLNTISINQGNHLLFDQLYCMQKYFSILSLRIEKMQEEKAAISRNNFKKVDNDHKSNDGEIVECFVIDGDSTPEDVAKAFGGKVCGIGHVGEKKWVEIPTKNGVIQAHFGDLIVKSINGELTIVKGVAI